MAESIVQGLFGLNPNQIRQQQQAEERTRAIEFAQLSPFERANMGMYQAGSQIAGVGMGMLGMQNHAMQAAKQSEDVQKQIDHSTPEGLMQGAQIFNQAGNPQMAYRYQQAAAAKQAELAEVNLKNAQAKKALADAEKASREPAGKNVIKEVGVAEGTREPVYTYQKGDENPIQIVYKTNAQGDQVMVPYTGAVDRTTAKVTQNAGSKTAFDISKALGEYDDLIKIPKSVYETTITAKELINDASTTNNSQSWEAARTTLAKAVGESRLSNEDIRRMGGDPRLVQGALDWVNKKISGVPNQDIMKQLYALSSIIEKRASEQINKQSNRARTIAREGGFTGNMDEYFPNVKTDQQPGGQSGGVVDFNKLPKKAR